MLIRSPDSIQITKNRIIPQCGYEKQKDGSFLKMANDPRLINNEEYSVTCDFKFKHSDVEWEYNTNNTPYVPPSKSELVLYLNRKWDIADFVAKYFPNVSGVEVSRINEAFHKKQDSVTLYSMFIKLDNEFSSLLNKRERLQNVIFDLKNRQLTMETTVDWESRNSVVLILKEVVFEMTRDVQWPKSRLWS